MSNARLSPLTWLGIALVVAVGLMAVLGGLTMSTSGGYYGMMGGGSWGWAVLMMGVPAVILILVLLAALGGLSEPRPYAAPFAPVPTSALQVLDERYARGELTREQYVQMQGDLDRRNVNP